VELFGILTCIYAESALKPRPAKAYSANLVSIHYKIAGFARTGQKLAYSSTLSHLPTGLSFLGRCAPFVLR